MDRLFEKYAKYVDEMIKTGNDPIDFEQFKKMIEESEKSNMATGGRVGLADGTPMKMASYGYDDAMGEAFAEFQRLRKLGEIPMDMEFDEYLDQLDIDIPYGKKQKQAPLIKLASAYDYDSFDHKINELKAAYKRYKKGSTTGGRKGTMTFEQFAPKFAAENFSTGGRVQAASGGLADILKV